MLGVRYQKNLKLIFALTFVGMIFMRMVWLQVRSYTPEVGSEVRHFFVEGADEGNSICQVPSEESVSAKGLIGYFNKFKPKLLLTHFCVQGEFENEQIIPWNQALVLLTTFIMVMTTRLLTGGWIWSLLVGVMILSRGGFLARIGHVSTALLMSCGFSFWFFFLIYYMKTLSRWPLLASYAVLLGLSFIDISYLSLSLVMPLLFLLGFLRSKKAGDDDRGFGNSGEMPVHVSILTPLKYTFYLMIPNRLMRNWSLGWVLSGAFLTLSVGIVPLALRAYRVPADVASHLDLNYVLQWLTESWEALDVHLFVSLGLILVYSLGSLRGMMKCSLEGAWVIITSLVLLFLTSAFLDIVDKALYSNSLDLALQWSTSIRPVMAWIEPTILMLGVICFVGLVSKMGLKYEAYN